MKKPSPLFEKLAAEEAAFFSSEFLCPVIQGMPVRVRIAGIVMDLKVQPKKFQGWGIFRTLKEHTAKFLREPTMAQRQEYLELFPRLTLVVASVNEGVRGIPANSSDSRFRIQGMVPILLPNEVRQFDTVDVRYDGANFWYDQHNNSRSPAFAQAMRDLLVAETEPDKVLVLGMTPEERAAYKMAFDLEIEAKRDRKEDRLRDAVERAGAVFHSYVERGNTYTVEMSVEDANGRMHRYHPVVDSNTLSAMSAGICLSGGDRAFDLQSLVSVFREGQNRHLIHRYGR